MGAGVVSSLAFAGMSLAVHAATELPATEIVFFRSLIGAVAMTPFMLKDARRLVSPQSVGLWFRCIASAISIACFSWNLQHTSAGFANALFNLSSLFAVAVGLITKRASGSWTIALWMSLIVFGTTLLCTGSLALPSRAVWIAGVLGALAAGSSSVMLEAQSHTWRPGTLIWSIQVVSLALMLLPSHAAWANPLGFAMYRLLLIVALGLSGHILHIYCLKYSGLALGSALAPSCMVFTVLMEAAVNRTTSGMAMAGCVVYAVGLIQLLRSRSQRVRSKSAQLPREPFRETYLRRTLSAIGLLVAALALPFSASAAAPTVDHPLSALTPQEYWVIYQTLRIEGHVHEKTLFASVLLHEPDKSVVLGWTPGMAIDRKADVVLYDDGKSYAALVDITAKKSDDFHFLKGEQAPYTDTEEHEVAGAIKKDSRILEALKKRGLTDLNHISCFPVPAGYIGLPEQKNPDDRIAWGGCTNSEGAISGTWDREVGGLFFVVDMATKKVLRVTDYGITPESPTTGIYDGTGGEALPNTKPILVTQPAGPSFTIDKGLVSWQNWRFRFRLDPRSGPILNSVSYEDQGKLRSVMYEGSLSEMYVPYQDPDETFNSHVFLDGGEYFMNTGLGMIKPLVAGIDCPDYSTFFSAFFYKEDGSPFERPQVACLFERVKGEASWRHSDANGTFGRPGRELVLRTVATVGNYDYILDWRFSQDGTITGGVGATGILEVKPVSDVNVANGMSSGLEDKNAPGGPVEFGRLIAAGTDAVNHDHFFSFRLDLDVDGQKNSFMVDKLVQYKIPGNKTEYGRHVIWAMQPSMPATEGEAKMNMSMEHPAMWRFVSSDTKGPMGYPTSYEIMAGENSATLLPPEEWPQKRAGFSEHQLWVTPYEPGERYAAGTYVSGSRGTDGLPVWTKKNRSIMNTDIVAWYTVGFHHTPRPEDWPQMPTMWHEFQIRPFGFFPKNPGMDLPMKP